MSKETSPWMRVKERWYLGTRNLAWSRLYCSPIPKSLIPHTGRLLLALCPRTGLFPWASVSPFV